jgi:NAD(P)-dependent dehydrogenase (short-subunit alcohol dehydrogenase family)
LDKNTASLVGKTVAVTGTTGGIGRELCSYIASLGASLILLDRNAKRSNDFKNELSAKHPDVSVECINLELESMASVKAATEELKNREIYAFIHNAGAYFIPRHKCDTGYDNVFQINFVSPYYIIRELLPKLRSVGGRAVVVGSIAHNYSKTDPDDVDFSTRDKPSRVYGNAKRYLMFALFKLFQTESEAFLSVTHPGITFTNITAHYPKVIYAIIKHPMKVIFMKPRRAALSVLAGLFREPSAVRPEWIGPRYFDIWGIPKVKRLRTASDDEREYIFATAEKIYGELINK